MNEKTEEKMISTYRKKFKQKIDAKLNAEK
jgi:hypothetical protein